MEKEYDEMIPIQGYCLNRQYPFFLCNVIKIQLQKLVDMPIENPLEIKYN